MAFEGYTQETLDFLWGIRFNNERGWFMAPQGGLSGASAAAYPGAGRAGV